MMQQTKGRKLEKELFDVSSVTQQKHKKKKEKIESCKVSSFTAKLKNYLRICDEIHNATVCQIADWYFSF